MNPDYSSFSSIPLYNNPRLLTARDPKTPSLPKNRSQNTQIPVTLAHNLTLLGHHKWCFALYLCLQSSTLPHQGYNIPRCQQLQVLRKATSESNSNSNSFLQLSPGRPGAGSLCTLLPLPEIRRKPAPTRRQESCDKLVLGLTLELQWRQEK